MSKVARNILSGVVGKILSSLAPLIFLPLYLPLLGKEAFGLIALSLSFAIVLQFINGALEPVMVREVARREAIGGKIWPLLRAQEYFYFFIGLVVALSSGALAGPAVAALNFESLPEATARTAMQLLLVAAALDLAHRPHLAIIFGRQEHPKAALVAIVRSWGSALGGYLALLYTDGAVTSFFVSYVAIRAACNVLAAYLAWRPMASSFWEFRPRREDFKGMEKITGVFFMIALVSSLWNMAGSWVVAISLPMATFALIELAAIPARAAGLMAGSVRGSLAPRLCELDAHGDHSTLRRSLRSGVELLALVAAPLFSCFIVFAVPLFAAWQRDLETAYALSFLAPCVGVGNLLLISRAMPLQAEFTQGKGLINLSSHLLRLLVYVPAIWLITAKWGLPGFALGFAAYGFMDWLWCSWWCFRRYGGKGDLPHFFWMGMLYPLGVSLTIGLMCRLAARHWPGGEPALLSIGSLVAPAAMLAITFLVLGLTTPVTKRAVAGILGAFGKRFARGEC